MNDSLERDYSDNNYIEQQASTNGPGISMPAPSVYPLIDPSSIEASPMGSSSMGSSSMGSSSMGSSSMGSSSMGSSSMGSPPTAPSTIAPSPTGSMSDQAVPASTGSNVTPASANQTNVAAAPADIRRCEGSTKNGVHRPCIRPVPERIWKNTTRTKQCRHCLANKMSDAQWRIVQQMEAAGQEACSNCYIRQARAGGGFCQQCYDEKKENAALRKAGQGKGRRGRKRKAEDEDDVPQGGPFKKNGNGKGPGPDPGAGAVGAVLSGVDQNEQMAF
ncbi:hypothetical protein B0T20DRAFT_392411 [Sordaria brevicollis]|uniref:Uncharacterized protein n=1 Tax=Sordaria brevicollis TaxID=83679 RepID=A0AAE0UD55_SORBR|nr:hypothetical protein B0T20DRAFT_392411 [Sordaria brevicollis]